MKIHFKFLPLGGLAMGLAGLLVLPASGAGRTLRMVTYNIEDDINGATTPLPGLIAPSGGSTASGGVLEGIGEEIVAGDSAQPIDLLMLEETTSNGTTVAPIVNGLNTFYNSPGMYAYSPYQATENGGDVANGNGPNALVYNTKTLQLIASVPVDPAGGTGALGSASGEYREVMRYELAPAGVAPSPTNEFYVYVSHYKSGTGTSNINYRGGEAVIVRNNATSLPAKARILYTGDFNVTTSGEPMYTNLLAATAPNGVAQAQGFDPLNPTGKTSINWGTNTTSQSLLAMETESATDLRYRDDFQLMTSNVYYQVPGGLQYVPGTYHTFGNNGTTPYNGSVNSGSNTSLNRDLAAGAPITASQLYSYLTTASDHLPMVADYTVQLPAASLTGARVAGANLVLTAINGVTNGVYAVCQSTNLRLPLAQWTVVATNTAAGPNFTLTLTNGFKPAAGPVFFTVQSR